jgi:hypothetical protein
VTFGEYHTGEIGLAPPGDPQLVNVGDEGEFPSALWLSNAWQASA